MATLAQKKHTKKAKKLIIKMEEKKVLCSPVENAIKINKWKVREGFQVSNGQLILLYELAEGDDKEVKRLKSTNSGVVKTRLCKEGDIVAKGYVYYSIIVVLFFFLLYLMCVVLSPLTAQKKTKYYRRELIAQIFYAHFLIVSVRRCLSSKNAATRLL